MALKPTFTLPEIPAFDFAKAIDLVNRREAESVSVLRRTHRLNLLSSHFNTDCETVEKFAELIEQRDRIAEQIRKGKEQFNGLGARYDHRWDDDNGGHMQPVRLQDIFSMAHALEFARADFSKWLTEREAALTPAEKAVEDFAAKNEIRRTTTAKA